MATLVECCGASCSGKYCKRMQFLLLMLYLNTRAFAISLGRPRLLSPYGEHLPGHLGVTPARRVCGQWPWGFFTCRHCAGAAHSARSLSLLQELSLCLLSVQLSDQGCVLHKSNSKWDSDTICRHTSWKGGGSHYLKGP